jgi:hypothetical protein
LRRRVWNIWVSTLKVKVTAWPCSKKRVRPITLLLEVGFNNYFTEMITILNRHATCNIWVPTLKVKVMSWPCSKIMSGALLCYLKSDFTTISQKWSQYWDNVLCTIFGLFLHLELFLWHNSDTTRGIPSCFQNLIGEHHPVQPALVFIIKCFWLCNIMLLYLLGNFTSADSFYGPHGENI